MKKLPELKESPLKEPSLITTLFKLKSNTFQRKLKKLLLSMSQLKEFGKEFSTCQLRPKSSITQKGTTTLLVRDNTSRPATLKEDMPQAINRAPAGSELKLSTRQVIFQLKHHPSSKVNQWSDKEDSLVKELTPKAVNTNTQLDKPTQLAKHIQMAQFILLAKPHTPLGDTQLEDIQLEARHS